MLSPSARPFIEASVPVLRTQGVAITQRFYASLFSAHPELKNLFNMGNQENGAQQGALAAAVLAYAANIDQPAALLPVIERIAHKHASVGIVPSQYPIVGRHLIGAIKDVLGEAATPELLSAWDEAYWLLAGELIAAEARLYERAAVSAGDLRELVVTKVVREGRQVVSYYLQTRSGRSPGPFVPGQYVSVAVDLPSRGLRQLRQYSLSDAPSRPHWRITVKSELAREDAPAGEVSNHLHAHLKQGSTLLVSAPFGNFAPLGSDHAAQSPLVLLSAGVGITPFVSALNALVEQRSTRPVLFVHAAQSREQHILGGDVRAAEQALTDLRTLTFHEQTSGDDERAGVRSGLMTLTPELLAPFAEADVYLCGPLPFMRAQWRDLIALGFSPTRLSREVFGPELLDQLS